MLLQMRAELIYFLISLLSGAFAALLGEGMDFLHRRGGRQSVWLGMLDLLYWFGLGFLLFLLCFWQNSGIFRGYAAAGTLLGYAALRWIWERVYRLCGGTYQRAYRRTSKQAVRRKEKQADCTRGEAEAIETEPIETEPRDKQEPKDEQRLKEGQKPKNGKKRKADKKELRKSEKGVKIISK